MRNLVADLAAIVGPGHVLVEPDVVAGYATDWTRRYVGRASCVVRPGSADEVAAVVRACAALGVAVVPQGGNTGLVAGSVPAAGVAAGGSGASSRAGTGELPVILSTGRLTGLGVIERAAGSVVAEAGVTIAALHAHAEAAGLRYGVDLASRGSATVGGTIATNAGGIHTIRYGPTRAQVAGVAAVLADGSVVDGLNGAGNGPAGYDLNQLLTGSEGTLAVITAARLRLWPVEPVAAVLFAGVEGIAQGVELYRQLRDRTGGLLAAEYLDAAGLELVCRVGELPRPLASSSAGYLLAELAGPSGPASAAAIGTGGTGLELDRLAELDLPADTAVATSRADQASLWAYRERLTEAIATTGVPHKVDVAVPVGELGAFRAELDEVVVAASAPSAASVIVFGHIGVGNLHVNVLGPDPADTSVDEAVARLAAAHGGSVAAEHGIGRAKTGWLAWSRSAAEISAMRAIKSALDPHGLLNPGVLVPDP
ncbi:MAG TPA: FAD-binding oxidoreductase [Streptosporangiaceae bacterium]|nr:FAD-binding oxidoreductase [Streptosporangiaceae bacterium]